VDWTCPTTGEAHSFPVDERIETMDALADSGMPTERMLIGTSALAFLDTIRLVRHAVGIKDSSGVTDLLEDRCRTFPDKEVFAGTDGMVLTALRAGGNGAMSGISNIVPDVTTVLYAGFDGEADDAMLSRIGLTPSRQAAA